MFDYPMYNLLGFLNILTAASSVAALAVLPSTIKKTVLIGNKYLHYEDTIHNL